MTLGRVDFGAYLRAFVLLARNPQLALAPLLAAVVQVLLTMLFPAGMGGGFMGSANSGLAATLAQIVWYTGFGVALIGAEAAWRRGRAPFDDTWEEGRRKIGDIAMAALGFTFIVYIAAIVGNVIPALGILGLVLSLVATYFFIYTIPAAAIGGIPGGAALQASLERARRTPLATFCVTVLFLATFTYVPGLIVQALAPLLIASSFLSQGVVVDIIVAAIKAVVAAYVALVLAKTYDDASYGRFR